MKPITTALLAIALTLGVIASALTADAGNGWTKATYRKLDKMTAIGFEKSFAISIINKCKRTAKDPSRCVTTASMIAKAESNAGKTAISNNVWGFRGKKYDTKEKALDEWIVKYNKYWYNSPLPNHYYPRPGEVAKTGYCTDEHSSGSKNSCPNGNRIAYEVYKSFK